MKNFFDLEGLVDGQAYKNALRKMPEKYLSMDEPGLRALAKPTRTDYAIRSALWNEVRHFQVLGVPIPSKKIYSGICTYTHFYNSILCNPKKLAWILQPVQEYEKSLEPLLIKMGERYHELLSLNIYDKRGKPNPQLIKQIIQVMTLLEGRLLEKSSHKGHDQKFFKNHFEMKYASLSPSELDKKIEILESKLRCSGDLDV